MAQTEATQTQLGEQVSQTGNELELAKSRVQTSRDELNDSEHELANTQKELQQVNSDLSTNQRTLTERDSKLDVLRQLNEEGAGLGAGSQAVLKGLDNPQLYRPAIVGALANFIEVNSEYIPAIEAALGQHLQAILVRDRAIGESIAVHLAEKKIGRAAIVPVPDLPKQNAVQLQSLPDGAIAWALDRVKCRPEVTSLVTRLLDNVVLASSLTSAFEIREERLNSPSLP